MISSVSSNIFKSLASPVHLTGFVACLAYSACSIMMTLTNKALLSLFDWKYPLSLLVFQHLFTLVLILLARSFGFVQFQGLKWETVKTWYPMNLVFVFMLITNTFALRSLSVPMVTIFKNIATAITTVGDFFIFGRPLSSTTLLAVSFMVFGSVVAGIYDLSFNLEGYSWMGINIVLTAAYVLYMKFAIKKTGLNEWGMAYYNNFLAIPTLLPMILMTEWPQVGQALHSRELPTSFYHVCIISGVSGFLMSMSSFWAVNTTSPTTYSIVGALNKIPLTILGFILFASPVNLPGATSIIIGLTGGVIYSYSKAKEAQAARSAPRTTEEEDGNRKV